MQQAERVLARTLGQGVNQAGLEPPSIDGDERSGELVIEGVGVPTLIVLDLQGP